MPRADGPAEETWETMTDEERRAAGDQWRRDGYAWRLRTEFWERVRARPVEPAHEGQMMLEDAR